jgi:hypothetical protein
VILHVYELKSTDNLKLLMLAKEIGVGFGVVENFLKSLPFSVPDGLHCIFKYILCYLYLELYLLI